MGLSARTRGECTGGEGRVARGDGVSYPSKNEVKKSKREKKGGTMSGRI